MSRAVRILVVDDDAVIREMIGSILEVEGYRVLMAENGDQSLQMLAITVPDLILLDVMMPGLDGNEVCRRLKSDPSRSFIPIIMLTALGQAEQRVRGLELGADDYLSKPFYIEELLARVRAQLRRSGQINANPLTGLPGNLVIEAEVSARLLKRQPPLSMLYCDLDNFKAFNDVYGFARGDDVIRLMAGILVEAVEKHGNADDFVGHVGGDDFVVLSTPNKAEAIARHIIDRFDRGAPDFYSPEDRQRGYTTVVDRRGQPQQFPLVSVSIGIVTPARRGVDTYLATAKLASEAKHVAKRQVGSSFFIDRRGKLPNRGPVPSKQES